MLKILDTTGRVLRINAPEWFQLPAFRALLDRGTQPHQRQRLATFHRHGDAPNEYSDIFVPFDAHAVGLDESGREVWAGEGSAIFGTEGLDEIWDAIVVAAQEARLTQGVVWISNLPLDSNLPTQSP